MENTPAQRIARRFVSLDREQRRQILDKMSASGQSFRLLPIVNARPQDGRIPLSYAQQRLLFLWQMAPDSAFYNVPMAVRLRGAIDEAALDAALQQLVLRHETLRTRFVAEDGQYYQVIDTASPVRLESVEVPDASPDTLQTLVGQALGEPFDLLKGPLLRVRLLRLGSEEALLTVCMHHIVSDGWSSKLMVSEFVQLYAAQASGVPAALPALPIQYADYAVWQRSWLEAGEDQRQLAYWSERLGHEPHALQLPLDHPRPAQPSYRGASVACELPAQLAEALRALARREGCTLFMLMLTALAVVLARHSGQADIRVGAPNAGRNREELEGLIGFFINTQVLRVEVDELASVGQLLAQVKETVAGAQAHQDLPFEHLVDALAPERDLSRNPLFQVKINQNVADEVAGSYQGQGLGALAVEAYPIDTADARFDLALDFTDHGNAIEAVFSYATDLFEAPTIQRIAQALRDVLQGLPTALGEPLQRLAPSVAARTATVEADFPCHDALALWQQGLRLAGPAPALRGPTLAAGEQSLDYPGLERQANRLAHYLQGRVRPGQVVALCLPRSIEWVVGLLATLKIGAVYLPLDPSQPSERLAQIVADSQAALLLHSPEQSLGSLADSPQCLAWNEALWAAGSEQALRVTLYPQQPAYIIYTSGSTGQPKGVSVSHQALANYTQALLDRVQLPADASLALVSTTAADLGHTVLFGALASGRLLHLLPQALAFDPDQFAAYMAEHRVGVLKIVPSHLQGLLQAADRAAVVPHAVLLLGGESCPWGLVEQVRALQPACRVFNHYGPTETTVGLLTHEVGERLPGCLSAPVGEPLANTWVRLLDDSLNPVSERVAGQLYLGGAGVALGYVGQPALTAERFVPDPEARQGERLYRSGDRGRISQGQVEFIGRADDQVKIRGYRVEPAEVSQALGALDGVREAVVLAVPLDSDPQRLQLLGYCVAAPGISAQALLEALARRLPEHALPAHLLLLERLPLTANGKLDRRALPLPGAVAAGYEAPQGEIESQLAAIWADVLKVERVGRSDNFFELGGDSILSLQIIARAKRQGLKLSPKQLFEKQSIEQLAAVVQVIQAKAPAAPADAASVRVPLLPIQARFFELDIPQRNHWNQAVLLTPRQPLSEAYLTTALAAVIEQHSALRLRFQPSSPWHAECVAAASLPLWRRALASLDELPELALAAQRSLDLEQGPLLRAVWVDLADGQHRLLLVIHHLVVDGVSWRVLLEDLQLACQQAMAGQAVQLPGQTTPVHTWAERLQTYASSAPLAAELDYWRTTLATASPDLPRDRAVLSLAQAEAGHASTQLGREHTEQLLKAAPAAYRTQVNDLLLTALARVLCQWSQQPSVLIQLEGHGREDLFDDLDLSRTVGWFSSLFPVCLRPASGLGESIKAIKEQLRQAPNKGLGYGVLRYLGDSAVRAELAALPSPRITFNYLGQFDTLDAPLFSIATQGTGPSQSEEAPLANWLSVNGQVHEGQLRLEWTYSRAMYDPATIDSLAQAYQQALLELLQHCAQPQHRGVSPSDFPLAGLDQAQLDSLADSSTFADLYPLSPMQQGMLFHSLDSRQPGDYINQMRVDIQGLEVERFRAAWQAVLDRHEVLRASFITGLAQPLQAIARQLPVPLEVLDWRQRGHCSEALSARALDERNSGFDVRRGPLLRLLLVRTGEQAWHLIYTAHHILMDGWSNSRLFGEVLQRYAGQVPATAGGRYRDYIGWLQRQDSSVSQAFWTRQLAALSEPTRLALALPKPVEAAVASGHGDLHQAFSQAQSARLEAFARASRVTLNTLLQAAWVLLLQRYSGQAQVTFGATVAGRPAELAGVEEQLGLFINTLPISLAPRPEQPVQALLQEVQAHNLALREHEHTPLYDIQRWVGRPGEALFDSLLVFENYPVAQALQEAAPAGLLFSHISYHDQTNYPLTLVISQEGSLAVHYRYDRRHWQEAAIAQVAGHFANLLEALADDANACVGRLPLHHPGELQRSLDDWNPARQTFSRGPGLPALIEAQVARTPHATAVRLGDQRLSYAQLNVRANRLAHRLREQGVGPEVRVGLAVERSLDMLVGLLAILKAGGAYVPMDPDYPSERLAYLLQDSGSRLLLTQAHLLQRLPVPAHMTCLCLDRLPEELASYPDSNPEPLGDGRNLAYVIYTSGSTGQPKGTLVPQENVVRLFQASATHLRFGPDDVWTLFHSYAFDFSVWEIFGALLHGGQLLIVPHDVSRSPEAFYALLAQQRVTVLNQTPSAFRQLMRVACAAPQEGAGLALRYVIFGGEALEVASLRPWFERFGDRAPRLINMYGITETTVHVTYRALSQEDLASHHASPIGQALADMTWYVLDGAGNPVPRGCCGELYIGQAGLARGYHQRAGLSAERFVPDPFASTPGARLYRTGDLVRYVGPGAIDYVGRIDQQVKIRGFRIELGEIQALLQRHAGVREAVVVAADGVGGQQLLAYLVPVEPSLIAAEAAQQARLRDELKAWLKAQLPDYMVPAQWLLLPELPLTANGKLDRKALPAPWQAVQNAYEAPRGALEEQLAAIWREVLQVPQVGRGDHFFDLGGHSLLVMQTLVRVREQCAVEMAISDLFEAPVLGDFCQRVLAAQQHKPSLAMDLAKSLGALKRLSDEDIDELIS
ncbi:amino acid adenylation domain-containing protein [Pseudomonas sp. nanlin1]|uniref:amino acid adenylation domain-containing protein n=1 Tax=Pseudomonas sp. nanlin1 TaxID=3040605 RepID=UPI0038906B2E